MQNLVKNQNDKVLTNKVLYSVILINPTHCRKVLQNQHGHSGHTDTQALTDTLDTLLIKLCHLQPSEEVLKVLTYL